MRPAFISVLFVVIGLLLIVFSGDNPIAQRVRRRTGLIFILVAVGLFVLDQMSR